ncbi:hypothetical protein D1646_17470 [Pseudoflavonifractor sp. 60]|nr:hypothetical protein [Pseudoflavonifractor sp. 60]
MIMVNSCRAVLWNRCSNRHLTFAAVDMEPACATCVHVEVPWTHQNAEAVRSAQLGDGILPLGQTGELLCLSSGDSNGLRLEHSVKLRLLIIMERFAGHSEGHSGHIRRSRDLNQAIVLVDIDGRHRFTHMDGAQAFSPGHIPISAVQLKPAVFSLLNHADFEGPFKINGFRTLASDLHFLLNGTFCIARGDLRLHPKGVFHVLGLCRRTGRKHLLNC